MAGESLAASRPIILQPLKKGAIPWNSPPGTGGGSGGGPGVACRRGGRLVARLPLWAQYAASCISVELSKSQ